MRRWQRQLTDYYDEVLGRIENLPDVPDAQEMQEMIEAMDRFFSHLVSLSRIYRTEYTNKEKRKIDTQLYQEEWKLKEHPAIKELQKFGQEC